MAWGIVSSQPMNQNELFNRTRWRLASWYAGVMGIILSLCSLGAPYIFSDLLDSSEIWFLFVNIYKIKATVQ